MDILDAIAALHFQFAKTMPETPHEYTVRSAVNEVAYVVLAQAVLDHGVRERYVPEKPRRPYWTRYLYPGDGWKYWLMTTALGQSRIINRARRRRPRGSAGAGQGRRPPRVGARDHPHTGERKKYQNSGPDQAFQLIELDKRPHPRMGGHFVDLPLVDGFSQQSDDTIDTFRRVGIGPGVARCCGRRPQHFDRLGERRLGPQHPKPGGVDLVYSGRTPRHRLKARPDLPRFLGLNYARNRS
jgi:hypothetical protein